MLKRRHIRVVFLTTLLLISFSSLSSCKAVTNDDNDEDLSFLEEADEISASHYHHYPDPSHSDDDDDDGDDADDDYFGDFSSGYGGDSSEAYKQPEVDDKDVVVLIERNFTDVVENNRFVMVEFYAPWCGHCQALAPEYGAAATELKSENVVLAKVDATVENELAHEYDVQGFPTVYFFIDGVHKPYNGQRTK